VEAIQDEAESYSLSDDSVLQAFFGALSMLTSSGVRVTQENAFRCVAVLACLIVRAETFSALPVHVLRDAGEKGKIRADDTAACRLLAIAPNDFMTARELWRWKQLREDATGNAYVRIEWGPSGYEPAALYPLYGAKPSLVIDRRTRRAAYQYTGDDLTPSDAYAPRDILHFKGPVLRTPLEGASLIDLASEAIGVAIGSEQFFARLLGNGTHFPGYLETERDLTLEDLKAITEQFAGYGGLLQAGKLRVFDRGLHYKQNTMSLKDAQLIEQERWQLQQICSVFRVPMAAVQDLTNGTYSNTEQQDLALGKHTVAPICVNTEAVCRARLFAATPDHEAKWNLDGLLRGDYETRATGDSTLLGAGVIDRNEARSDYDLNPRKGLDKPLIQLGYGTVEEDGSVTNPNADDAAAATLGALLRPAPSHNANAAEAVLEPLSDDAFDALRRRAAADRSHGRGSAETIAFARRKLEPLAAAHAAAGLPFDTSLFIAAALAVSGDVPGIMSSEETNPEEAPV
jgi:HK97 family phage portal protein